MQKTPVKNHRIYLHDAKDSLINIFKNEEELFDYLGIHDFYG